MPIFIHTFQDPARPPTPLRTPHPLTTSLWLPLVLSLMKISFTQYNTYIQIFILIFPLVENYFAGFFIQYDPFFLLLAFGFCLFCCCYFPFLHKFIVFICCVFLHGWFLCLTVLILFYFVVLLIIQFYDSIII